MGLLLTFSSMKCIVYTREHDDNQAQHAIRCLILDQHKERGTYFE